MLTKTRKLCSIALCVATICTSISSTVYAQDTDYVTRYDFVTQLCSPEVCNAEFISCLGRNMNVLSGDCDGYTALFVNPPKEDRFSAETKGIRKYIVTDSDAFVNYLNKAKPSAVFIKPSDINETSLTYFQNKGYVDYSSMGDLDKV